MKFEILANKKATVACMQINHDCMSHAGGWVKIYVKFGGQIKMPPTKARVGASPTAGVI